MRTHFTCAKDLLRYLIGIKGRKMMTIAYITINSGLVPLIEGLCAQILYFRIAIINGLWSNLLLFLIERKNILKKLEKAVSSRSYPAS